MNDTLVILTRHKDRTLDGGVVALWKPRFESAAKPVVQIFKILLPDGLSSSIPFQPTLVLQHVRLLLSLVNPLPSLMSLPPRCSTQ